MNQALQDALFVPAMVLFRTAGLFLAVPLFSGRTLPATVRVTLVVAVAAWCTSVAAPQGPQALPLPSWALFAVVETGVGLVWGWVVRFALEASYAAGHAAGSAMGFSYGATLDPLAGQDSNTWAQLTQLTTLGLAVGMGLHREVLAWLANSMVVMPPGRIPGFNAMVTHAVEVALGGLVLGVLLALPVLAAVLLGQLVLGLVGRTAAQLNLSTIGFTVTIVLGGLMMGMTLPNLSVRVAAATVEAAAGR